MKTVGQALVVALAYFLAARLGLLLAIPGTNASPFWPPSGVAVIALLVWGPRMALGVWMGALVANASTLPSVVPAVGIACGNTAEGFILWYYLGKLDPGAPLNYFKVLRVGAVACGVSAVVGSVSLWTGGIVPSTALLGMGLTWFLGDFAGLLGGLMAVFAASRLAMGLTTLPLVAFLGIYLQLGQSVEPPLPEAILALGLALSCVSGFAGSVALLSREQAVQLLQAQKQLEEVNQNLIRSNEELERFAYVASHDLQQPLRTISSYVEILTEDFGDVIAANEDAALYMGYLVEASGRLRRLVQGLLDYSRTASSESDSERVNLADCATEAVTLLGLELSVGGLPTIQGNRDQLLRVFLNLIGNAVKYSHPDRPLKVKVSAKVGGKEAVISIQDNGIGIAAEYQKEVFSIFKRLHREDQIPGTGMGLTITRKIVNRHGGRIWLESDGESGSTFYFSLPTYGTL